MILSKHDIQNEGDIKTLVDSFYKKVNDDPLISPIFNEVAMLDFAKHMPVMYSFWTTLLFGVGDYKGNPFLHHVNLPINESHFDRWLSHWHSTIDDLFTGEKAEEAKSRASSIAGIFQLKMKQMSKM